MKCYLLDFKQVAAKEAVERRVVKAKQNLPKRREDGIVKLRKTPMMKLWLPRARRPIWSS
jgi:hypothetical protein